MELRAGDILKHKDGTVVTIEATATVYDAIARMVDSNVGSILVMQGDTLAGIFTERDYLRRIILQGRTSKETRIADAMTAEVVTVDPGVLVGDCMAIMTQKKCRHLPVLEEGSVVGVVSIGDCVKEISKEAQARVQDLTAYITGTYPA
ncbi:MAG TPA: CBS domain-containing protein [Rhodothermales bacterium]|nr:CBS domain-containing protein [Rhodothermales bacterium]